MVTSRECRERAADCQEMAERELNPHVRAVLNDIARSLRTVCIRDGFRSFIRVEAERNCVSACA
jgi:hypothetical protein